MRKVSRIFLAILICVAFAILNIDEVKAATTCDYGIICKYHLNKGSVPDDSFYDNSWVYSYYQCRDNSKSFSECTTFVSAAHASIKSGSGSRNFDFWNYNDIYHQTDKFKDKISENGKFKCPTLYWNNVSKGGKNYIQASYNDLKMGNSFLDESNIECISQNQQVDFEKLKQGASQDAANRESTKEDSSGEKNVDAIKEWGSKNQQGNDISNVGNCDVIGGETRAFLNKIFSYISVIGIIIVVVMSMIDGIKVITASEDGAMGNFLKGLRVRAICLILLLVLPMLVTFVVSTINNVANIAGVNSDNPLCGVSNK